LENIVPADRRNIRRIAYILLLIYVYYYGIVAISSEQIGINKLTHSATKWNANCISCKTRSSPGKSRWMGPEKNNEKKTENWRS